MDRKEYERIKEHEKERLRMKKRLRRAQQTGSRARSVREALADMLRSAAQLLEEHDAQVDQLARETAHHEARLEVARESEEETPDAEAEEVVEKQQARNLIRQLKGELGVTKAPAAGEDEAPPASDLPDKTIGRMAPPDAHNDDEEGEET